MRQEGHLERPLENQQAGNWLERFLLMLKPLHLGL
jgi:hypothetical protein